MLLIMKSLVEGGRALSLFTALQHDRLLAPDAAEQTEAKALLALMVPIAKAFLTEIGMEATQLGVQCWGGHGYIRESGMEQFSRDVRVTAIYEGTNGIQANDLLRRKVFADQGKALDLFLLRVEAEARSVQDIPALAYQTQPLLQHATEWRTLTQELLARDQARRGEASCGAFDHLMYAGYVCLAYFWTRMAREALAALPGASAGEAPFLRAKLQTAQFYFERVLPRTRGLVLAMRAPAESVLGPDAFVE
jgi:hypothetical protein